MNITYIRQSGFTIEINKVVFLFDYFKGEINTFSKDKKIYVFVSHKHYDHFNTEIFQLAHQYEQICFILPSDMKMSTKYMDQLEIPNIARDKIHYVKKSQEVFINDIKITTLTSTDEGVAFIVEAEGLSIYHAGDLNYWSWQGESEEEYQDMTKRFKTEMKKIEGKQFDVAFLPVDPRQEDRYWWGLDYFMRNTDTKIAYPMHFWDDYSIINKLMELDCTKDYRDRIVQISSTNESKIID